MVTLAERSIGAVADRDTDGRARRAVLVFCLRRLGGLPLHVIRDIGSATLERCRVVNHVSGTGA